MDLQGSVIAHLTRLGCSPAAIDALFSGSSLESLNVTVSAQYSEILSANNFLLLDSQLGTVMCFTCGAVVHGTTVQQWLNDSSYPMKLRNEICDGAIDHLHHCEEGVAAAKVAIVHNLIPTHTIATRTFNDLQLLCLNVRPLRFRRHVVDETVRRNTFMINSKHAAVLASQGLYQLEYDIVKCYACDIKITLDDAKNPLFTHSCDPVPIMLFNNKGYTVIDRLTDTAREAAARIELQTTLDLLRTMADIVAHCLDTNWPVTVTQSYKRGKPLIYSGFSRVFAFGCCGYIYAGINGSNVNNHTCPQLAIDSKCMLTMLASSVGYIVEHTSNESKYLITCRLHETKKRKRTCSSLMIQLCINDAYDFSANHVTQRSPLAQPNNSIRMILQQFTEHAKRVAIPSHIPMTVNDDLLEMLS